MAAHDPLLSELLAMQAGDVQVITFQRKRANRRIINEEEFIKLLQTYAPVNVVEFNSSHSFAEQLRTVSQSGLFISVRHPPPPDESVLQRPRQMAVHCLRPDRYVKVCHRCGAVIPIRPLYPVTAASLSTGTHQQPGELDIPATRFCSS